ncbi:protein kinase domain-containing protein [Mammaliicoccus sciuri]|uniref:protein kinase domain-containing protein n=1 Tax=Mammaliicoccus sciuri TaxID=1296 RepID=UPI002B2645F2|nr:protein kinase [Mammaliicoccus sciuri]WQJ42272.1 protein kinase [Mammaliicoccus sciuri]
MTFVEIIKDRLNNIYDNTHDWNISKNKKRGQSDTFTIYDNVGNPILIAKFFDYLKDLKKGLKSKELNSYRNLDELIENIDFLDGIDDVVFNIDELIDIILLEQRCFKRYVHVCNMSNLGCFPKIIYSESELRINDSFYGFLIEEYVNGVTIEEQLPFSENIDKSKKTFDFLLQLGIIVEKLSSNGVVHRDISPDNVMSKENTYIVIDPGMVKMTDDNFNTKSRMILGKYFYASPEQYFGNAKIATFKSDLYALGVISLEMILGYNPLEKIIKCENKVSSPHIELLKKLDREIEDDYYDEVSENEFTSRLLLIIKKLLQVEDELRFDSVASFLSSLNNLKESVDKVD